MVAHRLLGLVVAGLVAGCVPAPANRTPPIGSDASAVPASTSTGPVTSAAPSTAGGPGTTPSFVRPTPNPSPTFLVYVVRAGDSLLSIGRLFGTTGRSVAYWNRDRYPSLDPDSAAYEPNRIEVGWTLLLIPTEVVAEDELPDPTPTATPLPASPGLDASSSPS